MTKVAGTRVYVGLSGGVDSAVCASILRDSGCDVTCIYMKSWVGGPGCSSQVDESNAVKVASFLGLPFQVWDFVDEYKSRVLDIFINQYRNGFTPNPDVLCNSEIKFGSFYDRVVKIDHSALIATGHYAKIIKKSAGNYFLASGNDVTKDQSYFLYSISNRKDLLPRILFPLGNMFKKEVREYARKVGLPNCDRPDSQGVCFIGDVNMRQFLSEYISKSSGQVINKRGDVIGSHIGLSFYTNGQRHGFTIDEYHTNPLYVVGKSIADNKLIVGSREDAYSHTFEVKDLILVDDFNFVGLTVRVRNLGKKVPCKLELGSLDENRGEVELTVPEFGVAPGQSAVFYKNDLIVGGGVISKITS